MHRLAPVRGFATESRNGRKQEVHRMVRSLAVATLFAVVTLPAQADILVGSYGDGVSPQPLRAFADGASGDALPLRVLGGPQSTIVSASGGSFEPNEGALYVADFWGQATARRCACSTHRSSARCAPSPSIRCTANSRRPRAAAA
jgi:hypothetical protein